METFKTIKNPEAKTNARVNFAGLVIAGLFALPFAIIAQTTYTVTTTNGSTTTTATGTTNPSAANPVSVRTRQAAEAQANAHIGDTAAATYANNVAASTSRQSSALPGSMSNVMSQASTNVTNKALTQGATDMVTALHSAGIADTSQYLPSAAVLNANSPGGYVSAGLTLAGATTAYTKVAQSIGDVKNRVNNPAMVYERDKINDLWQKMLLIAPAGTISAQLTPNQVSQKIVLQTQIVNILGDANNNQPTPNATDTADLEKDMSTLAGGEPSTKIGQSSGTSEGSSPNAITYSAPTPIDDGILELHINNVFKHAGIIADTTDDKPATWSAPSAAAYSVTPVPTSDQITNLPSN